MEYLDRLVAEMDPELKAKILGGEYMKQLEPAMFPEGHPLRRTQFRYALTAVPRGEVCAEIVSRFKPLAGARVLDIGCGDGGFCAAFARAGAVVTGFDINPKPRAMALARDLGLEVNFVTGDDYAECLPAGSFDIIVTNDVLEHVADFDRLARSQARLLAPGGVLYFNPPNRFSLRLLPSDPHYFLAGLSLMGNRMGSFYAVKVRRRVKHYHVNRLLGYYEVKRIYRRAGMELRCFSSDRIRQRLQNKDLPATWQRALAPFIPVGLAEPIIRLFVLDQWIFIGSQSGVLPPGQG